MNGSHVAKCLRSLASMLSGRERVEHPELTELVGLAVYGMPTLAMKRAEAGRKGGQANRKQTPFAPEASATLLRVESDGGVGGGVPGEARNGEDPDLGSNLTGRDQGEPTAGSKREANATLLVVADRSESSAIASVFAFWKADADHGRAVLDRKRQSRIAARLREGFTVEQLCAAIRNRRNDPFLMGRNDTGRVFDGIETLLRDAAQVERLEALTTPGKPVSNGFKSAGTLQLERAARLAEEQRKALA